MPTPIDPKYETLPGKIGGGRPDQLPGIIMPDSLVPAPSNPFNLSPTAAAPSSKSKTSWNYIVKRAQHGAVLVGLGLATAVIVTTFIVSQQYYGKPKSAPASFNATSTELKTIPAGTVGGDGQTLTIGGATILKGKVTAIGDVDVIGNLNTGNPLNISALQVAGAAILTTAEVKSNLSVAGTTNLQGNVTANNLLTAASLNVVGNGSVGGTLTAGNLSVKNETVGGVLTLGGHVVSGGATPNISAGSGVGGAGTVSISGNDRAGTVTINAGQSPPAGVLATVTFRNNYSSTPRVVIAPIGASTGALQYYLNRTSGGFTIATLNGAPQGTSFAFDYIVEQ